MDKHSANMVPLIENYVKDELQLIHWMSYIIIFLAIIAYIALKFVSSPYGRYASSIFGPGVPVKFAWFTQELPAFVVPLYLILFTGAPRLSNSANYVILAMLLLHYTQRTFIFPFLIRGGKPTPIIPYALAVLFCSCNGYMQGRYLTQYAEYPQNWTSNPVFILGCVLFVLGLIINIHSDYILRNLRKPGETGYKIPHGGMFDYISGANFFGEILEWTGFAVAAQNLPAFSFFFFTLANLVPRAQSHHRWYLEKFKDTYPRNRKAVIPFVL